jgi:hypothetical protein
VDAVSGGHPEFEITGFAAAPAGWRVVWIDLDYDQPQEVTAPIAGWLMGTDASTEKMAVEAATLCPGTVFGEAPSAACLYPVSEAVIWPSGVWKILGPGDPLPSPQETAADAKRRMTSAEEGRGTACRQGAGRTATGVLPRLRPRPPHRG